MRLRSLLAAARAPDRASLAALLAFTAAAIAGYAAFGLHPQLLARVPELAFLYGPAFTFFAQGHVWLAGAVLGFYLVRRIRGRWLAAFAAVYAISFASEFVGTGYGLPFGAYHYTDMLGPKWLGRVPWVIPLSWFTMAVPSYVLARRRFPSRPVPRVLTAAGLLLIWDLSLDPAMSYLTAYWAWDQPGVYYGMPLVNLAGWYLTGLVIMGALAWLRADRWTARLSARWMAAYYAIVLLMPLGMVVAAGLWGAVAATVVALAGAGWLVRRAPGDDRWSPGESQRAVWGVEETASSIREQGVGAYFYRHSRSFSFAARLLPDGERRLVASLYAFCRVTDDLVDGGVGRTTTEVEAELAAWLDRAERAYGGERPGPPWLNELMEASRDADVPFELVEQLAEGVRIDVGPVAFETDEELAWYTYRVASVVGLWLCHLYGATEPDTLRRAVAMGRAMQMTNILRDVGEDLRHDRVYLPASLLSRYALQRADLEAMASTGSVIPAYQSVLQEFMAQADAAYDYAFAGLPALPPALGRASAAAAAVYRGIHAEIARNGYDNLRRRAHTGLVRKVWLAAGGLLRLRRARRGASEASAWAPAGVRRLRSHAGRGAQVRISVTLLLAFLLFAGVAAVACASDANPMLERLRASYIEAVEDEGALERALSLVAREGSGDAVMEAYGAALVVLRAKHADWPHRKLGFLRRGLRDLDALVDAHPASVEIRYLRLLSCYFLPGILGRGWSVDDDFAALARLLPEAADDFPPRLFADMVRFTIEAGDPAPTYRARLAALLAEAPDASASPPHR